VLGRLADRARANGVKIFTALCLADNRPMLDLFRELGSVSETQSPDPGVVEVEISLVEAARRRELSAVLNAVARQSGAHAPTATTDAK
jgi:hypothetical protein